MRGNLESQRQMHVFETTLEALLDPRDELLQFSESCDWAWYERELSRFYTDSGRPAKPVRLMISLLWLKKFSGKSDEELMEHWRQNPYWQYFSGMDVFQWKAPCVPSELSHFRKRIGPDMLKRILDEPIRIHMENPEDYGEPELAYAADSPY